MIKWNKKDTWLDKIQDIFYWPFYRLWNNHISMWPYKIKWFWQRGRRGYSDRDTWSFDYYLIDIIIGGLNQLSKNNNRCPDEFFNCPHKDIECITKCETCEAENGECIACKSWEDLLINMSDGFKRYKENVMDDGILIKLMEGRESSFKDVEDNNPSKGSQFTTTPEITKEEWEKYKNDLEEEEKKFKIHFTVFQKYFRNLWD